MTTSATEAAFLGVAAALSASVDLPTVRRNAVFDDVFDYLQAAPNYGRALVLRAGDVVQTQNAFGMPNAEKFEIVRNADLEFYVAGPEGSPLNATFDTGLQAIFAAIEADPTLSGAVTLAQIVEPPDLGDDQAGAYAVLTALVHVQLTYIAARAY